ncbi:MAG: hypothetical protein ABIR80_09320 [Opitutaceae bacterium]
MSADHLSLAELVGPWVDPDFESGLIERMRNAWPKPIGTLTNHELATCLRQTIAIDHVLPIAKKRLEQRFHDESELDDEELAGTVDDLEYRLKCEQEHQRIMATRFDQNGPKA